MKDFPIKVGVIADQTGPRMQQVIIVPDFGTAPIARLQRTLRRLFESVVEALPARGSDRR